jgi:hypothetical protein
MSENVRNYLPPIHTSAETAFVQANYPYGYRGKCLRRVWIETTKRGQRFITQTSTPYYPEAGEAIPDAKTAKWNKPKNSIYSIIMVMFLDEKEHIHNEEITIYTETQKLEDFCNQAKNALGPTELKILDMIKAGRTI